jgi:hypothetical protein
MNSLQMVLLQDSNCIGIVTLTKECTKNEWCALGSSASAVTTGDVSFTTIQAGPWNNGMNPTRQGLTIIGTTRATTDIVRSHVQRVQNPPTSTPLAIPIIIYEQN